jgi:UrcA family protein
VVSNLLCHEENVMRNLISPVLVGCVLTTSLLSATANAADRIGAEPHVLVQYADLDLTNAKGVEVLYGRIEQAAQRLCTDSGFRRVDERVREQQCVSRTMSDTVTKIRNDRLAALYKQHTSKAG